VAIGWPELSFLVAGFALFASVINLTGNICLSRAYQTADASWLTPMDFSYLIFAVLWSRVIFDQWPSTAAIIGMSLSGTAGIITVWREHTMMFLFGGDAEDNAIGFLNRNISIMRLTAVE